MVQPRRAVHPFGVRLFPHGPVQAARSWLGLLSLVSVALMSRPAVASLGAPPAELLWGAVFSSAALLGVVTVLIIGSIAAATGGVLLLGVLTSRSVTRADVVEFVGNIREADRRERAALEERLRALQAAVSRILELMSAQ